MDNYINIRILSTQVLEINNFASDLMSCLEEGGYSLLLFNFLKDKIKSNYTREELLNFEYPSYSFFYGMDKKKLNKILDVIYR